MAARGCAVACIARSDAVRLRRDAGADDLTAPTVELLQALIRNECVNDGTPDSGHEHRNADLLQRYLEGAGLDVARYDSRPGRTSIVGAHRGL